MAGLERHVPLYWRVGVRRWAVAGWFCAAVLTAKLASAQPAGAWEQAVAARSAFESEPVGQHTKPEYAAVMDRYRAIYHGNPGDLHAPRAVEAVAELLSEQGHEFKDRKSLHDAAGQYEFLARAYPQSSLAAVSLAKAIGLLGPDEAQDAAELKRVTALLQAQYPRSAAARGAADASMVGDRATDEIPSPRRAAAEDHRSPSGAATSSGVSTRKGNAATETVASAVDETSPSAAISVVDDQRHVPGAAPAMVTGIRHWSTSTYTRVAIDLGGEVEYKAARVEDPDRIFFDLHGAKLSPGLAGKSFAITDDGFLKAIRAGQFGTDVARIVLNVQPVAEYSAFLLPNPTRLIIDIHGKQKPEETIAAAENGGTGQHGEPTARSGESRPEEAVNTDTVPAPVERAPAKGGRNLSASSLPPMAVTDGSAGFGLPAKRDQAVNVASSGVARPRVVVPAKPTAAKPVPNSIDTAAPNSTREVAAISEGPGVISATEQPTSRPVVEKSKTTRHRAQGISSKRQGSGSELDGEEPSAVSAGKAAMGSERAEVTGTPTDPAPPTSSGQSTLVRALGLKIGRIVIDAGHGGHDSGTLGPEGIEEKDVVLDVALRLGKLLHDRLGSEIIYTRADDTFIPLETRTAIANKAQADLFISVHANSSADPSARGVEVYYLNFTSDPEAMQVASRENAVSTQRVNQLSDLVKKIALKDKIDESRELAADVDTSLYAGLKKGNEGLKDRGVKKAPFVVLIGANMPSILAEISFVTNPRDAEELRRPDYRERVAESLYAGVAQYAGVINGRQSGAKKALKVERAAIKTAPSGDNQ